MKIKNIDHIVIPVSDIDKSLHFYTEVLGMEADTSNQRFAVKFGNQKINLHVGKAQFLSLIHISEPSILLSEVRTSVYLQKET